jgi:hypothetical protein
MKQKFVLFAIALAVAAPAARASTVLGLSIEDQARLSRSIVVGEVVSQHGVDDPENGIETEVTLRASHVLKGEISPGDLLVFRTRGGEANGVVSIALGEAVFRTGQRTLVFLEEIDGRLYNLGLSMGVWNVLEDRAGRMRFVRATTDGLEVVGPEAVEYGPLSLAEMTARIARAERNPSFEHPALREAFGEGRRP